MAYPNEPSFRSTFPYCKHNSRVCTTFTLILTDAWSWSLLAILQMHIKYNGKVLVLKLGLHVKQATAIQAWNSKCLLFAVNKEVGQLHPINVNREKTTLSYVRLGSSALSENTSFLYLNKLFLNSSHSLNCDLKSSTHTCHHRHQPPPPPFLIPIVTAFLYICILHSLVLRPGSNEPSWSLKFFFCF